MMYGVFGLGAADPYDVRDCPRCGTGEYTLLHATDEGPAELIREGILPAPPAESRVVGQSICAACGVDEALRDAQGLPPVPPDEWVLA